MGYFLSWPTEQPPGELNQILPTPEHFEQAASLVNPDKVTMPHGPDAKPYLDLVDTYQRAGYDELYIGAVGPHYRELINLFARDVLPAQN